MKKLLYVVLGLVILLIVAAFAAPMFLNPNQYKAEIQQKFRHSTGYDLEVKDNISVTLFPVAKAYVKNAEISNNSKVLADIDEITVYPKLLSLLSGKLEISSIRIQKPVLSVEKTDAGYNFDKIPHAEADNASQSAQSSGAASKAMDLNIAAIEIADGEVKYEDRIKGKTYDVTAINIKSSLGSLSGPLTFDANMKYADKPFSAAGKVDNFANPQISFDSTILGSKISYSGTTEAGKVAIKSADIGPLVTLLNVSQLQQLAQLPVDISADVNYSKQKIGLDNLKLTIGETVGGGSLQEVIGDTATGKADLKFQKINLDQLMPKAGDASAAPAKTADGTPAPTGGPIPQKALTADISFTADELVYKGVPYKNLMLKSTYDNGEIVLQPLDVSLPNNGKAEIYGVMGRDTQGRSFDGHVNVSSQDFRAVLQSLKIDVNGVKPDALKNFSIDSDLNFSMRDKIRADLSKTTLAVDDTNFTGEVSVDLDGTPTINLNGTISKIDLDKYIAPSAAEKPASVSTTPGRALPAGSTVEKPIEIIWLQKLPVQGTVNLISNSITYSGDNYASVRVKGSFKPGFFKFDEISAASKKIQIALRGSVASDPGKKAKLVIQANAGKIDTADFIKPKTADAAAAPAAAGTADTGKPRWSKTPIDLSILRKINLDLSANIASLVYGKYVFDGLALQAYVDEGKLSVDKFNGNVFGGKIAIKGEVAASAVPALAITMAGTDIDSYKLISTLLHNERVQGKISFTGSFGSSGISQSAMIGNLKGAATIAGSGISVRGFDIDGFVKQLTNISDPSGVLSIARTISGDNAVTYFSSVQGGFVCESGTCRTETGGIKLNTVSAGQGTFDGYADLVKWYLDATAVFNVIIPGDNSKQLPSLGFHIFGDLDAPKMDLNYDDIKRYISQKIAKMLVKSGIIPSNLVNQLNGTDSTQPAAATPNADGTTPAPAKAPKIGKLLGGALKNLLNKNQQQPAPSQ